MVGNTKKGRALSERSESNGFTLMEIIVVMALLAILSVMVLGSYKATQRKTRDLKRKSDLAQLGKSLELYYQDFSRYPAASSGQLLACGAAGVSACTWGTSMMENQATGVIYMAKVPQDSYPGRTYRYISDAGGTYFKLFARLENTDDKDARVPDYTDPGASGCGAGIGCNFGVSSTNVVLN